MDYLMDYNETSTSYYDYYEYYNDTEFDVGRVNYRCMHEYAASIFWPLFKTFILVTALPPNLALLGLLLMGKIATSSSQILRLSLSVLDVLYCALLPLDISTGFHKFKEEVVSANEAFSILNLVGCPLLATGMCVERYIAVSWPILYLELRKSQYRLVFSILVWILTLVLAILSYVNGIQSLYWPLTVGISILFGLMLLCLGGIIAILCKKGPGDNEKSTPQKKQAMKNVLAVLCPFTIAYLPIVALIPFQYLVIDKKQLMTTVNCTIFQSLFSFPNFGMYICPMFFLSHLKKHLRCQTGMLTKDQTRGKMTQTFFQTSVAIRQNMTVKTQPP